MKLNIMLVNGIYKNDLDTDIGTTVNTSPDVMQAIASWMPKYSQSCNITLTNKMSFHGFKEMLKETDIKYDLIVWYPNIARMNLANAREDDLCKIEFSDIVAKVEAMLKERCNFLLEIARSCDRYRFKAQLIAPNGRTWYGCHATNSTVNNNLLKTAVF